MWLSYLSKVNLPKSNISIKNEQTSSAEDHDMWLKAMKKLVSGPQVVGQHFLLQHCHNLTVYHVHVLSVWGSCLHSQTTGRGNGCAQGQGQREKCKLTFIQRNIVLNQSVEFSPPVIQYMIQSNMLL